jgi:hypothetical protein
MRHADVASRIDEAITRKCILNHGAFVRDSSQRGYRVQPTGKQTNYFTVRMLLRPTEDEAHMTP